jgi:hypothetical protein
MQRTTRRNWIAGAALAASILVAGGAFAVRHALERPVSVVCDQEEEPDPTGDFVMKFDVTNTGRLPVAKLEFRIADTSLDGSPAGEFSHFTLSGTIAPGATAERTEEVPEPPHYRTLKFSQIDCTLDRVVFSDGSTWP